MLVHVQHHLATGKPFNNQRGHPGFRFRRDIHVRPFPPAQAHQARRRQKASGKRAHFRHRHPTDIFRRFYTRRNGNHLVPGGDKAAGNFVIHALVQRFMQDV
ncbi:MAG: hypothetical protein BWY09_01650 [Candidatus Hydrogenedentes bacterium ADurb.Bin179]|nr:MAG: hypothetical protein BWY09_01650 [Candidatus Hydrogenedentes bacterium ADurb.Bin179]